MDVFPNLTLYTQGLATLQENAVLWIPGYGEYWTQNVLFIYAPNNTFAQVEAIDNVWNFSNPTSDPMNSHYIAGNGQAVQFNTNLGYYYYIDPAVYNLTTPYTLNLTMSVTKGGGAATVNFTYTIVSGANIYKKTYDAVTLFPQAKPTSATFRVGGYAPIGLPSDLEYVLGGPGGGTYTVFLNISATMGLYYYNCESYSPVPSAYSAGSDTAEQVFFAGVARDLENPTSPLATLSGKAPYTYQSTYLVWPAPVTASLTAQANYQQGTLTLSGRLTYAGGISGAPIIPLSNAPVKLELGGQTLTQTTTTQQGYYTFTWTHNTTGYYTLSALYPGTVALTPAGQALNIGVSQIIVHGQPGTTLQILVNNTPIYVVAATTLSLPIIQGQTITVASPQYYYPKQGGDTRVELLGFNNGNQTLTAPQTLSAATPRTLTSTYIQQYYVVLNNPYGQSLAAWYNASQTITLNTTIIHQASNVERWVLQQWVVNGENANNGALITVNTPLNISAQYTQQYYVNISSGPQLIQGWYNAGSTLSLTTPKTLGSNLLPLIFQGWRGSVNTTQQTLNIQVDSPIVEQALYTPSYTYTATLSVVLLLAGLAIGLLASRLRTPHKNTDTISQNPTHTA
ncbi:MAG: thermopsin family protease [Thermoprotei archaeon]